MFMTTGDLQRSHMIKGVVSVTKHLMFESDGVDQFEATTATKGRGSRWRRVNLCELQY